MIETILMVLLAVIFGILAFNFLFWFLKTLVKAMFVLFKLLGGFVLLGFFLVIGLFFYFYFRSRRIDLSVDKLKETFKETFKDFKDWMRKRFFKRDFYKI